MFFLARLDAACSEVKAQQKTEAHCGTCGPLMEMGIWVKQLRWDRKYGNVCSHHFMGKYNRWKCSGFSLSNVCMYLHVRAPQCSMFRSVLIPGISGRVAASYSSYTTNGWRLEVERERNMVKKKKKRNNVLVLAFA